MGWGDSAHQLLRGLLSPLLVSFSSVTHSGLGACTLKEPLSFPFPMPDIDATIF